MPMEPKSPVGFREYFEGRFAADLAAFLEAMPASQRKHYAKAPDSYSIAMNYLVDPRPALRKVQSEFRPHFAASLYFTTLMDQAMYYHHFDCYERYRRLTDYPKLTGACPGACMYLAEPTMALERTNLFDVSPSEYIQQAPHRLAQNKAVLDPIVKEGTAYFRQAFPAFLRRHFPEITEPQSFYRRVFNDWTDVTADPVLQAEPRVDAGSFHVTAGWGPLVEVRPESRPSQSITLTLTDAEGACLEIDFEATAGTFAGCRLQRYHKIGKAERPKALHKKAGLPRLLHAGVSAPVPMGQLVCSKRMTSLSQGDLYLDWSGGQGHDLASSFPLVEHAVLHFYYSQLALTGLCLEGLPVTIFNEMPLFEADGR